MNTYIASLALGTAAALALGLPQAEAGGPHKKYHGPGFHKHGEPTYLMETLDPTAQDDTSPGNMWVGSGVPATNFVMRRSVDKGVELAIKAHYRTGSDILPAFVDSKGVVHVEVPAGHQIVDPEHGVSQERTDRARWNFSFSYDVALNPANPDLDHYRGWLLIDVDPSKRTKYLPLKLKKLTNSPSGQQSGYGWKLGNTVVIGDDEGTAKVTQNSQNLAFYEDRIDANPHAPGKQSYAATDFGPGQFDVIMVLERGHHHRKSSVLHVVFDVVEPLS